VFIEGTAVVDVEPLIAEIVQRLVPPSVVLGTEPVQTSPIAKPFKMFETLITLGSPFEFPLSSGSSILTTALARSL
jgi:hypothetical protein